MLIGIVSDTHDHMDRLRAALKRFSEAGVDLVLHAGDFVSPFMVVPFQEAGLRVIGVFGNNDGDKLFLRERFEGVGDLNFGPFEVELGGRRIVLMHEPRALEALVSSGKYDLIVYGHTHQVDVRQGPPLVVNPGECGGWLSGRATCALVDLKRLVAEIIEL
ncbi:MAG TPA: metallophosphoesterase [Candidatus Acetothermia bacterium]|nr:metallophosphoesterase [Candidatus Acetothermia bacterium]